MTRDGAPSTGSENARQLPDGAGPALPAIATGSPEVADPADLVTFDCFDTVVTRAVGGPRSVAYVVAARLAAAGVVSVPVEVYVAARWRAEELVYWRLGDAGTLSDIAVQLADLLGEDAGLAVELERVELAVEQELSRGVPAAAALVERERAAGARVGFLSDTPLSREVVEGLLRAQGVMRDGDLLWVSNELGASKDRGEAYFEVAQRLGGVPGVWRHVGDNPRADVRMARLSGVSPTLVRRASLTRYEQILEDAAGASGGFSSLLAGASRRARLRLEVERPQMAAARASVATGVAAPLLVGYVLWCLRRAQRSGCRRVYFVARDGEVMLEIARRLVQGLDLDLDLRYLEGSRRAWLLPSMDGVDADRLAAVLGREEKVTVRNCLDWVDLTPEEVPSVLESAGFGASTWDERLDAAQLGRVVTLMAGPELRDLVTGRAQARTAVTQQYMRQAGLLDGEPYALVDIGWQGTVGRLLTGVLERCGGSAPTVECYFGVTQPQHDAPGRDLYGYMYDEWRGTGAGVRFGDDWVALEMFTSPTHGRIESYRPTDGATEAVHSAVEPREALAWGLGDLRAAIDLFCDELTPTLALLDPYADVRAPTWEALRTFWVHPTDAEVATWGDFPFEESDHVHYPIAQGFTPAQVLRSLAAGRLRTRRRGTWPAGVRASASKPMRALYVVASRGRVVVGKASRARRFAVGRAQARRRSPG